MSGTIKAGVIQHPDSVTENVTLNDDGSVSVSELNAGLVFGGNLRGSNLLHNGAMQVAQRGTSLAGLVATGYTTADRWQHSVGLGTWTNSVESDAPTGSGFRKSYKMLITAGADSDLTGADSGDTAVVQQFIEGQNLQAVKKGTASAEPLTLSFWTKSNKTGTYVVQLNDFDNTRHVSATYTVTSSGTWEQQTITFPADLTGAFDNDNGASLAVQFWLAAGTDYTSGTLATTWATTTTANRAVGQTNLAANDGNYWQITGVQLEVGSAATGFEFKGFEQELAECQRYFWQAVSGSGPLVGMGFYNSVANPSTNLYVVVNFPVPMRTAPVPTSSNGTNHWYVLVLSTSDQFNTFSAYYNSSTTSLVLEANAGTGVSVAGAYGYPCIVSGNAAASSLAISADL